MKSNVEKNNPSRDQQSKHLQKRAAHNPEQEKLLAIEEARTRSMKLIDKLRKSHDEKN